MNIQNSVLEKGRVLSRRSAYLSAAVVLVLSIAVPSLFWPAPVQAAIGVRGTATTAVTNNGTTISIALPGGVLEGDLLLATIADSTGTAITAPSGWTRVSPGSGTPTICVGGSNVTTVQVWWKVAASNEAGPYSFALNATTYAAGGIQAYSGVNATTPIDNTLVGDCTPSAGASTNLSAFAFNTQTANARVVTVWGQMTQTGNSNDITPQTSLTERVSAASSPTCGLLCNSAAASVSQSDETQATAGSTGVKTGTSTQSGQNVGYQFALRPAVWTFSQSGYRWFNNIDSADFIGIVSNPTTGDDKVNATALDTTNGHIYTAGYEGAATDKRWRIEKRGLSDGSLVSGFGGSGCTTNQSGVICSDPTTGDDRINAIAVDTAGGFLYAAGYDSTGANRWRLEKRSLSDGTLVATGSNAGGFVNGVMVNDPNAAESDFIDTIIIDTTAGHVYLGGRDGANNGQWRLEKRSLSDGTLVTAFNTTGTVIVNFANTGSKDEFITAMVIDVSAGNIYMGGFDGSANGTNNVGWRVEKRSMSTGALGTGFGNVASGNCADNVAGSSVYCFDPGSGGSSSDKLAGLALDSTYLYITGNDTNNGGQWRVARITLSSNTISDSFIVQNIAGSSEESIIDMYADGSNLYLTGYDNAGSNGAGGASYRWRTEKRTVAGALVNTFGGSGSVTSDPTNGTDLPTAMAVDTAGGHLYAVGFDANGAIQWRLEKRSTTDGSAGFIPTPLAAQDTVYRAFANQAVRLRWLLHIGNANLYVGSGQSFKLQRAPKSGTCDAAYVGEEGNFVDLTVSSAGVRYYDNPGPSDGVAGIAVSGDPAHSADTTVVNTYEEANNFTNSGTILSASDGLWDFAINEDGSTAFGAYCFRVVMSDGTATAVPTQVAEIVYCDTPRNTDLLMRGGNYFCDGGKAQRFFWSR